jgi:hypothetical protein
MISKEVNRMVSEERSGLEKKKPSPCNYQSTNLNDEILSDAQSYWLKDEIEDASFVLVLPSADALDTSIRAAFEAKLGGRRGVVVEGRNAEGLLALYSLYAFTDKLIVGSFDLPHGRKLRNLLDSGVATEKTLIDDVILGAM